MLIDLGVHVLDSLLWWLGDYSDEPGAVEYRDDAEGGVEANCELCLKLKSGVSGVIELSRTRNLRNTWVIHGEHGALEVGVESNPLVRVRIQDQDHVLCGQAIPFDANNGSRPTMQAIFGRQLDDFVTSCLEHRQPMTPGIDGRRVVGLIEACYAAREPIDQPWMFPEVMHKVDRARA